MVCNNSESYLVDGCSPAINTSTSNWASQLVTLRKNETNDVIDYDHVVLTFDFDTAVSPDSIELDLFLCPEWNIGAPGIHVYGYEDSTLVFNPDMGYIVGKALRSQSCDSLSTVRIGVGDRIISSYHSFHIVVDFTHEEIEWVHVAEVRFLLSASNDHIQNCKMIFSGESFCNTSTSTSVYGTLDLFPQNIILVSESKPTLCVQREKFLLRPPLMRMRHHVIRIPVRSLVRSYVFDSCLDIVLFPGLVPASANLARSTNIIISSLAPHAPVYVTYAKCKPEGGRNKEASSICSKARTIITCVLFPIHLLLCAQGYACVVIVACYYSYCLCPLNPPMFITGLTSTPMNTFSTATTMESFKRTLISVKPSTTHRSLSNINPATTDQPVKMSISSVSLSSTQITSETSISSASVSSIPTTTQPTKCELVCITSGELC